jgi:uncharacterized membrane protein YcaP (DUF421 family)
MSDPLYFGGWWPLVRILVVGVSMYVTLILFLRLSGSRTLSSMNAFDFIVTVAIGSVFGRALTAKGVSLAEAIGAFALLVSLQFLVTWLQVRWPAFGTVVTNPPTLLYFRGEFLQDAMRRERVAEPEVQTAVRKNGYGSVGEVEAVVLESSGEFSVLESLDEPGSFAEQLEQGGESSS